jgi:glucosamine 6-phosphate synthetase-like amidotransferase/phosphosugar isomerase protein
VDKDLQRAFEADIAAQNAREMAGRTIDTLRELRRREITSSALLDVIPSHLRREAEGGLIFNWPTEIDEDVSRYYRNFLIASLLLRVELGQLERGDDEQALTEVFEEISQIDTVDQVRLEHETYDVVGAGITNQGINIEDLVLG